MFREMQIVKILLLLNACLFALLFENCQLKRPECRLVSLVQLFKTESITYLPTHDLSHIYLHI